MTAPAKTHWLELRFPPAVLVAITALLMWLLARYTPAAGLDPGVRVALYRVFTLAGAAAIITGVVTFRRARTTVDPTRPQKSTVLVERGIYRLTRNPMYLGMVLLLLGWAVFLNSVWSLLFIPGFVLWMNLFQIKAEERALRQQFGEPYNHYCQRVRRWL